MRDSLNTSHGRELIEVSTPELPATELSVPRKEVSGDEMKSINTVPFYTYQKPTKSQPRTFVCLTNSGDTHDNEWKGETHRRIPDFFKSLYMSWSAFMWSIHQKIPDPGQSNTRFLPTINHNPSDISCVYSTLMHANECASLAGKTLVITFDQPLYWKAKCIVYAEPATSTLRNAIIVLGGFHTRMSFLGAFGFLMTDSRLLEILSQVYVPKTVHSMLQG